MNRLLRFVPIAIGLLPMVLMSAAGAVLLALLFVGSTIMAERITAGKYPAYKDWLKATSPWVPFLDLPFRLKARRSFFDKYLKK